MLTHTYISLLTHTHTHFLSLTRIWICRCYQTHTLSWIVWLEKNIIWKPLKTSIFYLLSDKQKVINLVRYLSLPKLISSESPCFPSWDFVIVFILLYLCSSFETMRFTLVISRSQEQSNYILVIPLNWIKSSLSIQRCAKETLKFDK